jgi:hypothetical protein
MKTLVGGSVLTSLFSGMSQLIGAPWGAVMAIAIIGLLATLILGLAQLAMPQESHDKVLLWEQFFAYRERRRTAASAKKSRPRRAVRASPEHDATIVALPRSATSSERTAHTPARSP